MKMVKGIIFVAGTTFLGACSGNFSAPITLENDATCSPLYVTVGQDIIVSLDSNPTTGYQWALVNQPEFLKPLEENKQVAPVKTGNMVGVPGKTVWHYKVNNTGTGDLQFNYQRPWEKNNQPNTQFNCKIISQ